MDQSTYTSLTGKSVPSSQSFDDVLAQAQAELEGMLGYPLDPSDWDNQYIEIGKSRNDCACPDADASDLDDPDEVEGAYRLYYWRPSDKFLSIDPATAIYKVKLVKDGITYKTFDADEYSPHWVNAQVQYSKYISQYLWKNWICQCGCGHWNGDHLYQLAVDADWAFEDLPADLTGVLASMLTSAFDPKDNIKSETITSHSYSKFDKVTTDQRYARILTKYAGPNGKRPSLV